LSDNPIKFLRLRNFPKIKVLNLSSLQLEKIELHNLSQLQRLNLSNNQLKDVSCLQSLTQLQTLYLSENQLREIKNIEKLQNLQRLDLARNQIQDIHFLKELTELNTLSIRPSELIYPPIWYAALESKKGKLGDYTHLRELPHIEKIWQLMQTKEEENIELAQQLAKGQGWTEDEFAMYKNLL